MYGPTAGFRAQYSNKYVTLSATPRITFALNDYTARMAAQGPAFTNPVRDHVEEIDFTTITQVSLLAEVNVSDSMTVFGGYDFLWSYRTARPFRSVDYDSTLGTTQVEPQLSLKPDPDLLSIEGLNAGILFRF